MKKLFIIAFIFLVILALFKCNPLGDDLFVKLTSISPDAKVSHMPSFTLTVSGSNFDSNSLIVFNGTEKETTFVSAAELTCRIDPDDIVLASGTHGPLISSTMQDKSVPVLVRTQLTGEGDSNVLRFTIRDNHTFNESIKIYDASWSSSSPQLSVDSTGNIDVVWTNLVYVMDAPDKTEIYFSRSINDGLNWSEPVNISNPLEHSGLPAIAVDSPGNINVVWTDHSPGNHDIYFSRSPDGGETWSQAVNISNTPGVSSSPAIAVDSAGNPKVVWYDIIYMGKINKNIVRFSHSADNGVTWSQPVDLSDKMEIHYYTDIAVDSAGNINVVWSDDSGDSLYIFFRRSIDNGATWSQVENVSHDVGVPLYPAMALDSAGNINLVWGDRIPVNEEYDIYFAGSIR